jgi:hypothetical protein
VRPIEVRAGFFGEGAIKASLNEFGTACALPRPFFLAAVNDIQEEVPAVLETRRRAEQYDTRKVAEQLAPGWPARLQVDYRLQRRAAAFRGMD